MMVPPNAKFKRRWYQFSLGGLLLATTVVAVCLALWLALIEPVMRQRLAVRRIEDLYGIVHYASPPSDESGFVGELRQWLWRDFFDAVDRVALPEAQITDVEVAQIAGLKQLTLLNLHNTQVTDAGLKSLRGLSKLEYLGLAGTRVTDQGVEELQNALPNCKIER